MSRQCNTDSQCFYEKTLLYLQNMQSSSATFESILPGRNSMRLAGADLPGMSSELSSNAAQQLTSAEQKKVGPLQMANPPHYPSEVQVAETDSA